MNYFYNCHFLNFYDTGFKEILYYRPLSTPDSIVFPWDLKGNDFSYENFDPQETKEKLSIEEMDRLLDKLEC